jgi:hypothetical protein
MTSIKVIFMLFLLVKNLKVNPIIHKINQDNRKPYKVRSNNIIITN